MYSDEARGTRQHKLTARDRYLNAQVVSGAMRCRCSIAGSARCRRTLRALRRAAHEAAVRLARQARAHIHFGTGTATLLSSRWRREGRDRLRLAVELGRLGRARARRCRNLDPYTLLAPRRSFRRAPRRCSRRRRAPGSHLQPRPRHLPDAKVDQCGRWRPRPRGDDDEPARLLGISLAVPTRARTSALLRDVLAGRPVQRALRVGGAPLRAAGRARHTELTERSRARSTPAAQARHRAVGARGDAALTPWLRSGATVPRRGHRRGAGLIMRRRRPRLPWRVPASRREGARRLAWGRRGCAT